VTQLHNGDCLEVMKALDANSVDTIITDPPYGLSFMGKAWDHGVPGVEFWREALRVAKPGAMLLAFGGSRTYHRLTCAIEDAGWEVRDCVMWLYGSGFPKSWNLARTHEGREWRGYGTALKPGHEPILLAMKPTDGTFAANAAKYGVAGLNIDGARVGTEERTNVGSSTGSVGAGRERAINLVDRGDGRTPDGRDLQTALDRQARYAANRPETHVTGRWPANVILDEEAAAEVGEPSRFFYTAKASRKERGEGNIHPTVKPLALMRYLAKLTKTPTGGVVLDPFMGSGTTGIAALREGRAFIGIELNPEYYAIAARRIAEAPNTLEVR
jgi:DNA modification methylase